MTNAAMTVDRTVPNVGINGFGRIGVYYSPYMDGSLTTRPSCTTTLLSSNRPSCSSHQPHRPIPRTSHDCDPPRFDSRQMSPIRRDHLRTSRSPRPSRTFSKQPYPLCPLVPRSTYSPLFATRSEVCRLGQCWCCIRDGVDGEDDDKGICQCAYHAWWS